MGWVEKGEKGRYRPVGMHEHYPCWHLVYGMLEYTSII